MTGPENFTKVPNHLQDWLMTAKLNMTQFRIVHAIIRHTYGYHRTWAHISLMFLSEKTGCIKRQVTRELKKLIDAKIIIERYEDDKRLLRINPKVGKSKRLKTTD